MSQETLAPIFGTTREIVPDILTIPADGISGLLADGSSEKQPARVAGSAFEESPVLWTANAEAVAKSKANPTGKPSEVTGKKEHEFRFVCFTTPLTLQSLSAASKGGARTYSRTWARSGTLECGHL